MPNWDQKDVMAFTTTKKTNEYKQFAPTINLKQYHSNKPDHQKERFKCLEQIINSIHIDQPLLIMGDLNLDQNPANNLHARPDIKDTLPLYDDMDANRNLCLMNSKPTRFMAGNRPSLLDLF